mmetsp:Transcript_15999/g.17892  ORF Transcript_15999/g.17892 Transcript_15999/m.17892 type:complete len:576 (+) Transcript_15999:2-1729(+)
MGQMGQMNQMSQMGQMGQMNQANMYIPQFQQQGGYGIQQQQVLGYGDPFSGGSVSGIPFVEGDDEKIDVSTNTSEGKIDVKSLQFKAHEFLEVKLQAAKNAIDRRKKQQTIPCMASIKAQNIVTENQRVPLDVVFLVDVSGSMMGQKIQLVRETFDFLIDEFGDNDRVSLIQFDHGATRLTPLKRMTAEGKKEALDKTRCLNADGGTDIASAVEMGLRTLKSRKYVNQVTSILLLSDGQDSCEQRVKELLDNSGIADDFTINTFGYGNDHDPKLMGNIAEFKDGVFHYIENLEVVAASFADCVGGLMSVIAKNIRITVRPEISEKLPQVKITKVFMDDRNLKENRGENPRTFTVNYSQMLSATSKDFVFMLQISNPDGEVDTEDEGAMEVIREEEEEAKSSQHDLVPGAADIGDDVMIASAICEFVPLNGEESVSNHSDLTIQCRDGVRAIVWNDEVLVNYFRSRTAEALKTANTMAKDNALEGGRKVLKEVLAELEGSSVKSTEMVQQLIRDTNDALRRMQNVTEYRSSGDAYLKSMARNHMMQQSTVSNMCYQNDMQGMMMSKAMNNQNQGFP